MSTRAEDDEVIREQAREIAKTTRESLDLGKELAAWRYVAQAFRDSTGSPAIEARDGEHDPWLERAQNLYNEVANTYGTPEPNRFVCATCGGIVWIDEDGCCKSCGADTIAVFDPDARDPA